MSPTPTTNMLCMHRIAAVPHQEEGPLLTKQPKPCEGNRALVHVELDRQTSSHSCFSLTQLTEFTEHLEQNTYPTKHYPPSTHCTYRFGR